MIPHTTLNAERLTKSALEQIDRYRKTAHLALRVANTLERMDGKQINKRIVTVLNEAAPDISAYLKDGELSVWTRDVPYAHGVKFKLTEHPTTGKFCHQLFMAEKYGIARYMDLQAQADDLMATVKDIPALVAEYNQKAAELDSVRAKFGKLQYHFG